MPEFQVTGDVINHVMTATATHLRDLNQALTTAYGDAADVAFSLAIGAAIATTLSSCADPDEKANAVEAINGMLVQLGQPWRLVMVS
jgi:hypothetical protein